MLSVTSVRLTFCFFSRREDSRVIPSVARDLGGRWLEDRATCRHPPRSLATLGMTALSCGCRSVISVVSLWIFRAARDLGGGALQVPRCARDDSGIATYCFGAGVAAGAGGAK